MSAAENQAGRSVEGAKRAYSKPVLRAIELAVAEVLGGDCKLTTGNFAFGAVPCTANGCELPGS